MRKEMIKKIEDEQERILQIYEAGVKTADSDMRCVDMLADIEDVKKIYEDASRSLILDPVDTNGSLQQVLRREADRLDVIYGNQVGLTQSTDEYYSSTIKKLRNTADLYDKNPRFKDREEEYEME